MGKKPAISAKKRAQIVSLSTIKLSEREISRQIKVSNTAVHTAIKDHVFQGFPAAGMTMLSER